ncbi:MAG TPA: sodium:calcium antiporter [Planctomycetota bacterium]|nr:sodium:calcium antiporter [Planctomycetota bacterium]
MSLALNILVFVAASVVVWKAGVRLSEMALVLSERTGLGKVFVGTLVLGLAASLPELTTGMVAARRGQGPLALNTLLGGVAVTMAMLAVADLREGRQALSAKVRRPIVPLEGIFVVLGLLGVAGGVVAGDRGLLGFGAWTLGIGGLCLVLLWVVQRNERHQPWTPSDRADPREETPRSAPERTSGLSTPRLALALILTALMVVAAGYGLAVTSEGLAAQTGLGAGFAGFFLAGVATSLPELGTIVGAVRLRQFEMAFGDAFGSNLLSLALVLPADWVAPGGPILLTAGRFTLFAVLHGIALTMVYVVGLLFRRRATVLRMGVDSLAVLVLYVAGTCVLFRMR